MPEESSSDQVAPENTSEREGENWCDEDIRFMEAALKEARKALAEGEVPVG